MSRRSRSALMSRPSATSMTSDVLALPASSLASSALARSSVIVTFCFAILGILPLRRYPISRLGGRRAPPACSSDPGCDLRAEHCGTEDPPPGVDPPDDLVHRPPQQRSGGQRLEGGPRPARRLD